jgi:hypothetical protein
MIKSTEVIELIQSAKHHSERAHNSLKHVREHYKSQIGFSILSTHTFCRGQIALSRSILRTLMKKINESIPQSTPNQENGGTIIWRNKCGQKHRLDGPAVTFLNGTKEWWANDKRHRTNNPAVIFYNQDEEWWDNGALHRVGGPAILYSSGREEWFNDGVLHRVNGPALITANGVKKWYFHGLLHRTDGPAIDWGDGQKEYWLNGKKTKVFCD